MNRTALGIDDFFEIFVIILMLSTKELFTEEATPGEYNNLLFTFSAFFLEPCKTGAGISIHCRDPQGRVFAILAYIWSGGGSCRGGGRFARRTLYIRISYVK